MNYFKDKNEVYAYDDEQLSQVARISELEEMLNKHEQIYIDAQRKLTEKQAEFTKLHEQLNSLSEDELTEEELIELNDKVINAQKELNDELIVFNDVEQNYKSLKSEYDAIEPVFFDIREHLKIIKKMTAKEVDAHINPPKSKEQYIAEAEQKKQSLLAEANIAISPLQDAIDLDMAADEGVALLKEWKKYRVLLNLVDTSLAPDIDWPQKP